MPRSSQSFPVDVLEFFSRELQVMLQQLELRRCSILVLEKQKKNPPKLDKAHEPSIGWGESSPKKTCIGT